MDKNNQNRIEIELTDEIAQGTYSNLAIISHSQSEVVFDFVRIVPGTPKAKVKSRVLMTPERAKALLEALQDNINKYENSFGKIKTQKQGGPIMPINFGGNPQA
ncbi:MAG: DUF3467 domain-containing protein [Bacteroidales bacterium]|nr:DUF3467 domain-containing protein [Bacteroidales bacterium]